MGNAVGDVTERQERKPYARFERVVVEDAAATRATGHYVGVEVDYALVTPPYSKDIFKQKVGAWFQNLDYEMRNSRIPAQWIEEYRKDYERWKNGQELPLHGSPIRGWGVISPGQQEALIRQNILTVEDLAGVNDEGVRRIGMGGMEMKNKAVAWLSQLKDKGPLTIEIANLKSENDLLHKNVATLTGQVQELMAQVKASSQPVYETPNSISAADIMDDEVPPKKMSKKSIPDNRDL